MNQKTNFQAGDIVEVAIYYSSNMVYSYLVPEGLSLLLGSIVEVPLGSRRVHGIVVGEGKVDFDPTKLKKIIQQFPQLNYISPKMLEFMKWCASYNMTSLGMLLKMVLPSLDLIKQDNIEKLFYLDKAELAKQNLKTTAKRNEIIQLFEAATLNEDEIKNNKQISQGVFKELLNKGIIKYNQQLRNLDSLQNNIIFTRVNLNSSQSEVIKGLTKLIAANQFSVSLLDGVPGSGKTEVYFELINEVLNKGQEVLILLPEIALSLQWLERFKSRFNVNPYIWHSDVNNKNKRQTYLHLLENKVKVMVGTRSSLFLPFNNLGLIIVDEEHDSSFKQEEIIIYNARDMAIVKAKTLNIPIVLATATPSVETWHNVKNNKYSYFKLEGRYNAAPMPMVSLIDMREVKLAKDKFLSQGIIDSVAANLARGEQSLLFINRRGYAPLNLCTACGSKVLCPKCSAGGDEGVLSEISLVEHKTKKQLICHHCGYTEKISKNCKSCEAENTIISYGPGVEKIAEEASAIFPNARVMIVSSDVINSSIKAENLINKIINHEVDILVGTQLIAKGYHFPLLSLVGVIDANIGATGVDLKSNERAWQLLYQVIGRAGREKAKGRVVMQTYNPNSQLIQSLVDFARDKFLELEIKDRETNHMPPFSKLAGIIISSSNENKLIEFVMNLKNCIPNDYSHVIKGPIPALLYKVNNKFRYRFLVNTSKQVSLQRVIATWINSIDIPNNIAVKIDIDPISFY